MVAVETVLREYRRPMCRSALHSAKLNSPTGAYVPRFSSADKITFADRHHRLGTRSFQTDRYCRNVASRKPLAYKRLRGHLLRIKLLSEPSIAVRLDDLSRPRNSLNRQLALPCERVGDDGIDIVIGRYPRQHASNQPRIRNDCGWVAGASRLRSYHEVCPRHALD